MIRIVDREGLYEAIAGFLKDYEVIGPKDLQNKGIFYQPISNAKDLYLGDKFTIEPAKKFFLSPSEWLFKETFSQGNELIEELALLENKRIIFGVRPCEARGLTLLDKVFDSEHKDSFYINNRKRTAIVGLSCLNPDRDCFCASMGGSPVESRGMDALIFEAGHQFIIEIITDRGKELFGSLGKDINEEQRRSWEIDKEKRKNSLKRKIKPPERLDEIFESSYWSRVSFPCLSCGICTYLCPTCHCFDLVNEERKRLRCYDGCAFCDFTLQASGENPRPTKKERLRQRVFHKFDYFRKNFGENLCIGCGRCIRYCPVKIDITDIVANAPLTNKR